MKNWIISLVLILCVTACNAQKNYNAWMGRWIGPEGTFLELTPDQDGYDIAIQTLDELTHYQGKESKDGIMFERAGRQEIIRSGTGQDTGMKWLLDKKTCLVVRTGEGFCR